jgi:hypothetical protein
MVYTKKVWKTYTIEELKEIAKSCMSKEDFREKYRSQYNYCLKHKISKEILDLIPHKRKWTKESLIADAKKYNKRSDWMNANMSAYNTALRCDYYEECVSHMEKKEFGRERHWTYELVKEIYSKYNNIMDLRINDSATYNASIRYGWHKELSKNLDRGWKKTKKWDFEAVAKEALKYNSIKDLQKNNSSAYNVAIRNKWLMDVIGHMNGGNTKWTIEKLIDVLSKYPKNKWYKTKECHTAFVYMKRHKLQDKVLEKLKKD